MARRPLVARSVPALRKMVARYRAKGETVALVPTMGALHDGHLSLVRAAHKRASRVIVSIFVNPAQFAPTEDFKTYPRTFNADLAMLAALTVDLIWAPTVREPDGLAMSSRNVYLSAEERAAAATLYRVLRLCAQKIAKGRPIATILAEGREAITRAGFSLDYLEARHAETLVLVKSIKDGPVRLLAAAKLGNTRLIDNVGV